MFSNVRLELKHYFKNTLAYRIMQSHQRELNQHNSFFSFFFFSLLHHRKGAGALCKNGSITWPYKSFWALGGKTGAISILNKTEAWKILRTNHKYGKLKDLFYLLWIRTWEKNSQSNFCHSWPKCSHNSVCSSLWTETIWDLIVLKQKAEVTLILILFT